MDKTEKGPGAVPEIVKGRELEKEARQYKTDKIKDPVTGIYYDEKQWLEIMRVRAGNKDITK